MTGDRFEYRDDWWQSTTCPYCRAGRNEPCRSKSTGNTVSPHNARLYRALANRRDRASESPR